MEVIKLPKKFRMVCYDIMDGKDEALNTLETFSEQYTYMVRKKKPFPTHSAGQSLIQRMRQQRI